MVKYFMFVFSLVLSTGAAAFSENKSVHFTAGLLAGALATLAAVWDELPHG